MEEVKLERADDPTEGRTDGRTDGWTDEGKRRQTRHGKQLTAAFPPVSGGRCSQVSPWSATFKQKMKLFRYEFSERQSFVSSNRICEQS